MVADPFGIPPLEARRREIMAAFGRDNHAVAALQAMRDLAQSAPKLPSLQMDLAALAIMASEFDIALAAARRLMKIARGDFAAMRCAADTYLFCGQEDKAMEAWKTVTGRTTQATALASMARLAERASRMDQATALVERALSLGPNDAMAVLTAGRIASKRGDHAVAVPRLQRCTLPVVPAGIRSQAYYELGEILDRENDPVAAVRAWRSAKHAVEEGFAAEVELGRRVRARVLERNRVLCDSLTPAMIQSWRRQTPASPMPPLAVLAGHPRSGTTLLEQVLAAHPEVIDIDEKDAMACALRETLFPGVAAGPNLVDLHSMPESALAAVRHDYLRRLSALRTIPTSLGLLLDKNPNLTDFLPFLLRPFPEVRILVARRDPRDILLSCFRLPVLPESGNVGWLREEDAVEDYQSMMRVWDRLRDCLDDGGWLEVCYENLCAQFNQEARKVTAFLGLEWHPAQDRYREIRALTQAASPSYAAVRAPVHRSSIGRWQRYADLLPGLFSPFSSSDCPPIRQGCSR